VSADMVTRSYARPGTAPERVALSDRLARPAKLKIHGENVVPGHPQLAVDQAVHRGQR
jgi:hypothetical protein